jgi:hypothetical protein
MTDSGWRKRQIADEIHSCSPFCDKSMCVAEAVQAERKKVLKEIADAKSNETNI